mmetsp:Transcript_28678/g.60838  ORF Transcript_28678/g.60838 Transcript_28678/m.60838 type:complete len:356 (+) Transcript_28678:208-1275(+)
MDSEEDRFGADSHAEWSVQWWAAAVTLTLIGTTFSASGLLIQKYSHGRDDEDMPLNDKRAKASPPCCGLYFLSRWWILGLVVFITGHLIGWCGLALGTQVVLSCLNVWSMVVTFVIAPLLLNETVSAYKVASVLLIILGVVIVILYGPRAYRPYTVAVFKHSLDNVLFLSTSAVVLLCLSVLGARAYRNWRSTTPCLTSTEFTLVAAVIGWYSVLSAKCSVGLLFTSLHYRQSQFQDASTWIVFCVMAILAVLNVHFMNMAMKYGDAVFVVPLYESLSMLGQVFLGGIFFRELEQLTITGHIYFWFGVVCVVLGIICMTGRAPENALLNTPVLTREWPTKLMRAASQDNVEETRA